MSLFSSREKPTSNAKSLIDKVPAKGKRIRIVEVHSKKVTVTNEKNNG